MNVFRYMYFDITDTTNGLRLLLHALIRRLLSSLLLKTERSILGKEFSLLKQTYLK
jgi:hypothetical protein